MVERGVTLEQIRLTLEEADRISTIGNDRRSYKRHENRILVVAWHIQAKTAIIRTVFWQ